MTPQPEAEGEIDRVCEAIRSSYDPHMVVLTDETSQDLVAVVWWPYTAGQVPAHRQQVRLRVELVEDGGKAI